MSSDSELFKAASLVNLELEDVEGEDVAAQSLHLYEGRD